MLIIEGPDGSGKTTLAKNICEELSMEYRRYPGLSSTTGPDGFGIVDWWQDQIRENSPTAVYDRCFFVSEVIYQLATHPRELMVQDAEVMRNGLTDLWLKDARWIFCNPPWERSRGIIMEQSEKLKGVTELDLHKIHWAYESWSMMTLLAYPHTAVKRFNFTRQDEQDVMRWVVGAEES